MPITNARLPCIVDKAPPNFTHTHKFLHTPSPTSFYTHQEATCASPAGPPLKFDNITYWWERHRNMSKKNQRRNFNGMSIYILWNKCGESETGEFWKQIHNGPSSGRENKNAESNIDGCFGSSLGSCRCFMYHSECEFVGALFAAAGTWASLGNVFWTLSLLIEFKTPFGYKKHFWF